MKISIIIPVYNVEQYVVQCLQSVADQTWKDGEIECIVVDDCGTDRSMELVEEFISSYSGRIDFKVVRHEKNRGLSAARNTGMDAATGDYLTFLDSDDTYYRNAIEVYVSPLLSDKYDLVIAPNSDTKRGIVENGMVEGPVLDKSKIFNTFCETVIANQNQSGWHFSAWNKLYRTDFIKGNQIRFEEDLLFEDGPWTFLVMSLCSSVFVTTKPVLEYRIRGGSIMTGTSLTLTVTNLIKGLNCIHKYCELNVSLNQGDVWRFFLRRNNVILYYISQLSSSKGEFNYFMQNNKLDVIWGVKQKIIPVSFLLSHLFYILPRPFSYYYWKAFNFCRQHS